VEQRALKRTRRIVALTILVGVIALASWWTVRARAAARTPAGIASAIAGADVRAPQGVRIRVEVLNATRTRGLGRRATRWLRDGGFDVVFTGTSRDQRDSTIVLDRTGHPEWARAVANRMGGARVESRPDSSRHLDVTVLVGGTFRAPPQTLYP
jgi:hypothetical protein